MLDRLNVDYKENDAIENETVNNILKQIKNER